jgi:hypothetical protein
MSFIMYFSELGTLDELWAFVMAVLLLGGLLSIQNGQECRKVHFTVEVVCAEIR